MVWNMNEGFPLLFVDDLVIVVNNVNHSVLRCLWKSHKILSARFN